MTTSQIDLPMKLELERPPAASRYVAAICPICGGWTMFHGEPDGATAREWTLACFRAGDLIVNFLNPASLGPACPNAELPLRDRACGEFDAPIVTSV